MKIKVIQTTLNLLEDMINNWLKDDDVIHVYNIDYHIRKDNDVIVVIRYEEADGKFIIKAKSLEKLKDLN